MAVVIEPSHQTGIQPKRNLHLSQIGLHCLESLRALFTESVQQCRSLREQLLRGRVLAVENAQRIGGQSLLRIRIQPISAGLEPGHKLGAITLTIVNGAKAVDLKFKTRDSQITEQIPGKGDHFSVTPS